MRVARRTVLVVVTACAMSVTGRPAAAAGTIDTLGASIDSGLGTVRGRVVVNAAAPLVPLPVRTPLEAPPALGSMSGSIPAFPGGGQGVAALSATTDRTFSAGTYDFTSIDVAAGVTLTCTGPVEFLTTGDVNLAGAVRSATAGASIRFTCGGNFTMSGGGATPPAITTAGSNAPVTIDAAGTVALAATAPATGVVSAASGDVTIHGRSDTAAGVSIARIDVTASAGAADIRAAGGLTLDVMSLTASGAVDIRAYDGTCLIRGSQVSAGPAIHAEAASQLVGTDTSSIAAAGPIDLAAFGDRLNLTDTTVEVRAGGTGDLVLRSLQHMFHTRATLRHRGTGDLRVESQWADIVLRDTSVLHDGTGDILLREGSMVLAPASSQVVAANGDVRMHGNHIEAEGDVLFSAPTGTVEIRCETSVTLRRSPSGGPERPRLTAARIDVHAQKYNNTFDVTAATAGSGGLSLLLGTDAGYPTTAVVRGDFTSGGPLTVQTTSAALLDLAGASFTTVRAATYGPSAPVTIETFVAGGGQIDLDGATVRTGDAPGSSSGDVTIAARVEGGSDEGGEPSEPLDVVDGGILVHSARAVLRGGNPSATRIDVVGVLDTGALAADLEGEVELTVGHDARTLDVARDRRGALRFRNPAVSIELRPDPSGASRVAFRLRWSGDASDVLDADGSGQLDLRLRSAAVDARASIRLAEGRYRLGRRGRDLLAPRLAPLDARVRLADGPKDRLDLRMAFVTDGAPPEAPDDVEMTISPTLTVTVPAAAFRTKQDGVFEALRPSAGVERLTLDWRRGEVRLVARDVEFGSFPGTDGVSLDVSLRIGTAIRFLRLRLGRRGSALRY